MGMFDYVECRYPLPANLLPGDAFQTKDLMNAMMHYVITEDGRLEESSGAEDRSDFTGTVVLGWSNVLASGPGVYTADGEGAHYLQYALTFVHGHVTRVQEMENRHEPALGSFEVSEMGAAFGTGDPDQTRAGTRAPGGKSGVPLVGWPGNRIPSQSHRRK
jgi:hypothetical protein